MTRSATTGEPIQHRGRAEPAPRERPPAGAGRAPIGSRSWPGRRPALVGAPAVARVLGARCGAATTAPALPCHRHERDRARDDELHRSVPIKGAGTPRTGGRRS